MPKRFRAANAKYGCPSFPVMQASTNGGAGGETPAVRPSSRVSSFEDDACFPVPGERVRHRPNAIFSACAALVGTCLVRFERARAARSRLGLMNRRGGRPSVRRTLHTFTTILTSYCSKTEVRLPTAPCLVDAGSQTLRGHGGATRRPALSSVPKKRNDNSKRWITRLVCR